MSFFDKLLDIGAIAAGIAVIATGGALPALIASAVLTAASGVNNYLNAKELAKNLQS